MFLGFTNGHVQNTNPSDALALFLVSCRFSFYAIIFLMQRRHTATSGDARFCRFKPLAGELPGVRSSGYVQKFAWIDCFYLARSCLSRIRANRESRRRRRQSFEVPTRVILAIIARFLQI